MTATLDPKLRNGIGSSEVAMLFGCSPYGGPLELFMRIVHPERRAATKAQRRGIAAERFLAQEYAERHGLWIADEQAFPDPETNERNGDFLWCPPTQRHPEHARLIASTDRVAVRGGRVERLVEIKTGRWGDGWEDPDEVPDGVPMHYACQVLHQLLVGVDVDGQHHWPEEATLVASIGHLDDYREYTFRRAPKFEAEVVRRVEAFWRDHVEPRRPPEYDGSAAGERLLKTAYPFNRIASMPTRVHPGSPAAAKAAALRRAELAKERAAHGYAVAEQLVRDEIGDRAGIDGEGFRITWRANRAGVRAFRAEFDPSFPDGVRP